MIKEIVFIQYTGFTWKLITVAAETGRVVFLYFGWKNLEDSDVKIFLISVISILMQISLTVGYLNVL